MLKRCFKCSLELPLSEFYRHTQMADGYLGKCKECTKRDVRADREQKLERYREYDRQRANEPHRVEARRIYAQTPQAKEAMRKSNRRRDTLFSYKKAATTAVNNAIRDGRLVRAPCETCGAKAEAHHDDYGKPLDVRWLCKKHHTEHHKQEREDKRMARRLLNTL